MLRRKLLVCIALAPAFAALAQARVARVAWLGSGVVGKLEKRHQAFVQELESLGYRDGKNLSLDWRLFQEGHYALSAEAAELVRTQPEVIVASGNVSVRAAQNATSTIPIVMAIAANPIGEAGAVKAGLKLHVHWARGEHELAREIALLGKSRVRALIVGVDPLFFLISCGHSLEDSYRIAARHVHKILSGMKPADIPVEQPSRFELVINQKTAKALGIKIPRAVLLRADELIE